MSGSRTDPGVYRFSFGATCLTALPSGALWWEDARMLVVSDLHLGKSERLARQGGPLLPPFDATATLARLADDLAATGAGTVLSLGDGFDDTQARIPDMDAAALTDLQKGRRWIWVAGNHDPGAAPFAGESVDEYQRGELVFRHIATEHGAQPAEISGHYHPKHGPRGCRARPCFLLGASRLILPAYGSYTGGMAAQNAELAALFPKPPLAILTGAKALPIPL